MTRSWRPAEKRLLLLSLGLCTLLGGGALIFDANNRVPEPRFRPLPSLENNALDLWQQAVALQVAPPTAKGLAVDVIADNWANDGGRPVTPYSREAFALYPLARKRAFLAANAPALKALREGLKYPYQAPQLFTPQQRTKAGNFYARLHSLLLVLQVEAHAKAQNGNFDGAADSLWDIEMLSSRWANGGDSNWLSRSLSIANAISSELSELLPHLSSSKARQMAKRMSESDAHFPSVLESLRVFEREDEAELLTYCHNRDFEPLYRGSLGSARPSPIAQLYWKWNNKSFLVNAQRRSFDWQFAQAKLPLVKQADGSPFDQVSWVSDDLESLLYWNYAKKLGVNFARRALSDRFIAIRMALHAYHLEHGTYPSNLSELVPRFLPTVPQDPYSNGTPFHYSNKPKTWQSDERSDPVFVVSPTKFPYQGPGGWPLFATRKIWSHVPYTLYSVGPDGLDDKGLLFEQDTSEFGNKYHFNPYKAVKPRYDVVAGVNA